MREGWSGISRPKTRVKSELRNGMETAPTSGAVFRARAENSGDGFHHVSGMFPQAATAWPEPERTRMTLRGR